MQTYSKYTIEYLFQEKISKSLQFIKKIITTDEKIFYKKKNILVINHSSVFGGATQSLLIYIQNNLNYFNFTCITPKGSSSRIFNENNIKTFTKRLLPI